MSRAKSLYVQQAQQAKKTAGETRRQAQSYGLNEDRAVTDLGIAEDVPGRDPALSAAAAHSAQTADDPSWTPAKELRYQELLKKRGGK
jgi:hypothetical protein